MPNPFDIGTPEKYIF